MAHKIPPKKLVLVVALLGVMAGAWGFALRGGGGPAPAGKVAAPTQNVPAKMAVAAGAAQARAAEKPAQRLAAILAKTEACELAAANFVYDPAGGRDPMGQYASSDPAAVTWGRGTNQAAPAGLALSGIVWDASNPMAIINHRLVKVGDVVAGGRVASILPGKVVIVVGEQERVLTLPREGESDVRSQDEPKHGGTPSSVEGPGPSAS